jgi:hypothetical protein
LWRLLRIACARINGAGGVTLSWSALREQFGHEYRDPKDFKRELRRVLQKVLAAYPDAKVESIRGGLRLKPSKPPIGRKGHLVALPTERNRELLDLLADAVDMLNIAMGR